MESALSHFENKKNVREMAMIYVRRNPSAQAALNLLQNGPSTLVCSPSVVQTLLRHQLIRLDATKNRLDVVKFMKIVSRIYSITAFGKEVL